MVDAKKQIAVVLSGCGVYDGAEVHESVCTLLAIDRLGAEAVCFAPNIDHAHVIDHLSGDEAAETRNVLVSGSAPAGRDCTDHRDSGNCTDLAHVLNSPISAR